MLISRWNSAIKLEWILICGEEFDIFFSCCRVREAERVDYYYTIIMTYMERERGMLASLHSQTPTATPVSLLHSSSFDFHFTSRCNTAYRSAIVWDLQERDFSNENRIIGRVWQVGQVLWCNLKILLSIIYTQNNVLCYIYTIY